MEIRACPICHSTNRSILFEQSQEAAEWKLKGTQYYYIGCADCTFIQANPIPSEQDLVDFYQDQYAYDWFQKNIFYKKQQAKHRLYKIRGFVKPGEKVLDFGCGHGFFVQQLSKDGYSAYGFDIGADKISHHNNGSITNKNTFAEYGEKGFDVITLWHVLEHMRDQQAVLADLRKRLDLNGRLIIAVPNTNSLAFKLVKQKWGWFQQPYVHINHYNSNNLSKLLEDSGFEIVSISTTDTWDQNIYDLLISYFFYRNKSRNVVRKFNDTNSGGLFFRANQIVRLLFTPISYFVSFIRKNKREGNELMIVAKIK